MYTHSPLGLAFALGWFFYGLLVYGVKSRLYPRSREPVKPFPLRWIVGHEATLIFSLDFWLANCFKNRIAQFSPDELSQACRGKFIRDCNRANVWLSIAFLLCAMASRGLDGNSLLRATTASLCVYRFISRSWEIGVAFVGDVSSEGRNRSGLGKYERLRLALWSYAEIFVYAAAVYTALSFSNNLLDGIVLSLGVGTLSNVGMAFGGDRTWLGCLVFIQVLASMSLVLLGLVGFLSNDHSTKME